MDTKLVVIYHNSITKRIKLKLDRIKQVCVWLNVRILSARRQPQSWQKMRKKKYFYELRSFAPFTIFRLQKMEALNHSLITSFNNCLVISLRQLAKFGF